MTVHDRAAKTYKTLNDAGRSHDECLREAVSELAVFIEEQANQVATLKYHKEKLERERDALRDALAKTVAWRFHREFQEWKFTDNRAEMQALRDMGYTIQPLARALSDGGQKND